MLQRPGDSNAVPSSANSKNALILDLSAPVAMQKKRSMQSKRSRKWTVESVDCPRVRLVFSGMEHDSPQQ
jgi:hypothetical protein